VKVLIFAWAKMDKIRLMSSRDVVSSMLMPTVFGIDIPEVHFILQRSLFDGFYGSTFRNSDCQGVEEICYSADGSRISAIPVKERLPGC
jgi:hypothetical protein